MPPEPLPWDRRDFRKHERSGSDPRIGSGGFGGGGPHRWREQQHHQPHAPPPHPPPYHHQQQQRWYSDFRSSRLLPPGHGKQGGWHMYPDDAGHGFPPFGSRYGDRNLDDENCRPFGGSRGDGRYLRNSRENRGSFSQKDWKTPSWDPSASPNGPGKPTTEVNGKPTIEVNNLRSIENTQSCNNNSSNSSKSSHAPHHPSDSVNLPDQSQSLVEEKNDKNGISADGPTSAGQKPEKECVGSIDWKPLKWTRSGSLSSRGSGLSHSSSPKNMGVDSSETVVELQPKIATPIQSPSADAAACVISTASAQSDETGSRKKPRLGWGEGLAKYEKKKVEGPEDCATKNELGSNTETLQCHVVDLPDKSPGPASLSDCASPSTPSSVACSSSPGIEVKGSLKEANADRDTTNLSCSPSTVSQTKYNGPSLNLESLDIASIANLSSSINELLHSDDPSSTDTSYMRNTSMNKLLVWKVNILKALEMTESEVDSLETELKSLIAEPRSGCACPAGSSSLPEDCQSKPCEEQVTPSKFANRPALLLVDSSGETVIDNAPVAVKHERVLLKDEDIDSPGSATSKFVEVLPAGEEILPSDTAEFVKGSINQGMNNSSNLDERCSKNGFSHEGNSGCIDNNVLIGANNCGDLGSFSNMHCEVDDIYDAIISSNKNCANRALEELHELLPAQQCVFDNSVTCSVSSLQRDSSVVKEKFLRRKRFLQFKEKVLTLKFKVFQHFWKEGRIVSVRKLRVKTQKKFDPNRNGLKKNRSSSRSRLSSYAGGPQTVPADEVIKFVNALLSESAIKPCRNTLKMPALILDKETKMSRFISKNGLVEDPCAVEKERAIINPWTSEEKEIFIDKLAAFGKDFGRIASFLDHKTIADCIEFYYKNHKSESFEKARKNPDFVKQGKAQSTTYLVASGKRWNREANAASLDILGAASEIAANVDNGIEIQRKSTSRFFVGASSSYRAPRSDDTTLQRSNSLDMYSNERETVAADVLAGICGSLSSEAMSSCITSSVDPGDGYQDWRCARVACSVKPPLTPEVTQNGDDECSDESCGELDPTDWTDEEKSIFIHAVSSYGKDFLMISQCVRTKSMDQCKVFFSKARKCLGLDLIQPGAGTVSGDVNGGGSDVEYCCAAETGSVICNNGSECKMEDLPHLDMNSNYESDVLGPQNLRPDFKINSEGNNGVGPLDPMTAESVPKNSLMGGGHVDDKPLTDSSVDSKELNGADDAFASVQELGTIVVSSNSESEQGVEEEDNPGLPNGLGEAENNRHCGEENQRRELLLPEENLDNKTVEDRDANSSEVTDISSAVNEMKSGHQLAMQVDRISGHQKKAELETCSAEKSCLGSLQQNGHSVSVKSSTLFSVPIEYQKNPNRNGLLAVDANGVSNAPQKILVTGGFQQHLLGHSLSDSVESPQILRGYPVSVQTMKEINGDVNCKKLVTLQNVPKQDRNLHSDRHRVFFLEKCNGSRKQSNVVEASLPSLEQSRDHPRPQSGSSSSVDDKPSRTGDVKLFGKILISSQQQKPNSCVQQANDNKSQDHKASCHADQKVNFDSAQSKFHCNNYVGSENIPVRSFGFWDGNRIQTGFPAVPDSALLLSKYPAAFSNCAIPTVSSVFPSRELSSSNGRADYQVLRNRELQPFTIDMKQPQDVFTEIQRRKGFDLVSGVPQQARGMLGINGQDSGVSDPVAALKLHFAKAELSMMQGANVSNNDHVWRSNGDVGR